MGEAAQAIGMIWDDGTEGDACEWRGQEFIESGQGPENWRLYHLRESKSRALALWSVWSVNSSCGGLGANCSAGRSVDHGEPSNSTGRIANAFVAR